MYSIILSVINAGSFELTDILRKIDTLWLKGDIDDDRRTELIDAYRGMVYTKDLYYRDSEDGQIYKCFRDNDSAPGTGVRLDYLPHELVNIYFYFTRILLHPRIVRRYKLWQ